MSTLEELSADLFEPELTQRDRMRRALAIGRQADLVFYSICRRRGLDPDLALLAPLRWLAIPPPRPAIH